MRHMQGVQTSQHLYATCSVIIKRMSTIERMSYYASLDIPPIAKTKSVEQPAVGDCWECEREMSKANNALEKLVATEIDYGVQYANLPRGFHLIL